MSIQIEPPPLSTPIVSIGPPDSSNGINQYEHAETVAALAFGLAQSELAGTAALNELLASADRTLFPQARSRVRELSRHDRLAGDQAVQLLDAAMAADALETDLNSRSGAASTLP